MTLEIVFKEKLNKKNFSLKPNTSYFSHSFPRQHDFRYEYCGERICCPSFYGERDFHSSMQSLPQSFFLLYASMEALEHRLKCTGCLDSGLL